jgi:hypothetical protein
MVSFVTGIDPARIYTWFQHGGQYVLAKFLKKAASKPLVWVYIGDVQKMVKDSAISSGLKVPCLRPKVSVTAHSHCVILNFTPI